MNQRENSLDALRGLAILLMVLSGSIAFGILPGWMYHAQVPPPAHVFRPDVAGVTWVDLVFPFFLFAMGAAIPLAMQRRISENASLPKLLWSILQRYFLLVFFALFTIHARAWVMKETPGTKEYILSSACFGLLFLIYTRWKVFWGKKRVTEPFLKAAGILPACLFLLSYPFSKGGFDLYRSDIIILVLANMALFGTVIWLITHKRPLLRIALLPFIMAVFLAAGQVGTINNFLFNWSPAAWMYKFYYLKYLFIILPGTLAGDWLLQRKPEETDSSSGRVPAFFLVAVIWSLLLCNVIGLYSRWLVANLIITVLLCMLLFYVMKTGTEHTTVFMKFRNAGIYLLLLGLFFEAYEGGIRKDISTYSYYFVSTGLAFLILLSLMICERQGYFTAVLRYLALNGRNPMIAYTAGNLLLIPLMRLSGTETWLNGLTGNAFTGILRGVIFTGMVSAITVFCTKRRVFWNT